MSAVSNPYIFNIDKNYNCGADIKEYIVHFPSLLYYNMSEDIDYDNNKTTIYSNINNSTENRPEGFYLIIYNISNNFFKKEIEKLFNTTISSNGFYNIVQNKSDLTTHINCENNAIINDRITQEMVKNILNGKDIQQSWYFVKLELNKKYNIQMLRQLSIVNIIINDYEHILSFDVSTSQKGTIVFSYSTVFGVPENIEPEIL